ncbi:hypothetical protein LINPERPRIM_LOCUS32798 [Linum perenne]
MPRSLLGTHCGYSM